MPLAKPGGRAILGVDLQPLAYWCCGFESRLRHGYLSVVSVVCCQVEVPVMGRSPSGGDLPSVVCPSVISKPQLRGGLGPIGLTCHERKG
jgi:hypothetical protein